MNTTDEHKDSLAALYALGALGESERLEADLLYKQDSEWQSLLGEWQQRLDPLTQLVDPVSPPNTVWNKIQDQLDGHLSAIDIPDINLGAPVSEPRQPSAQRRVSQQVRQEKPGLIQETVELLRQRARYWQMATVFSVVSMACLAAILVFKPSPMQQQDMSTVPITVAVLQNEQSVPLWAVSLRKTGQEADDEYGELLITVVGEPSIADTQSHQMWMVLKDSQGVQSVGLLPDTTGEVRRLVLPRPLSDAAELAVSLEAKGGVPGPEHGPVVTRTFVVTPKVSEAI
ncbi:anti-sigma factor [Granulosicoccus antarcticus]|uniref:Anti-sigma K factor RskA C-terminal domain-containing protein n=1 Tax=Granulosicoccus antarcticus IMCC3135 TaxID=1192854 RepID=A0A2Z2NRB7_9GAMM|nr:anti-sigma factor [Granulosicoccus antarcticus]ASJ72278.1 hypothetical protein IMCC3135_10930 [Granulosicoccus antarcticus IMCC3135]